MAIGPREATNPPLPAHARHTGLYHPPHDGDRAAHLEYIDGLPITPLPEAFGLHANADIAKDQVGVGWVWGG